MGFPKQMYKGSHNPDKINAEEKVVTDDAEEKAARKLGFIDGKEFFAKPSEKPDNKPITLVPAKPAPVAEAK